MILVGLVLSPLISFSNGFGLAEARGDDDTSLYFQGLRERGLFRLAESYCFQRLASADLPLSQRIVWTCELARTLVEHAQLTGGPEREELWLRAAKSLSNLLENHPGQPGMIRVEAERANVSASFGIALQQQSAESPHDTSRQRKAYEQLELAIRQLTAAESALEEALKKASRRPGRTVGPGTTGEPTPFEIRQMQLRGRLAWGEAVVSIALLLPEGTVERKDELQRAEQRLKQAAVGQKTDETALRAQVLLARVARLRGDAKQAAAILKGINAKELPSRVLHLHVAERIELALLAGHPDEALEAFTKHPQRSTFFTGELQYLKLQALLKLRQVALAQKDAAAAQEIYERAGGQVRLMEEELGGYWAYRSRRLFEDAELVDQYGADVLALVSRAKQLYAEGSRAAASRMYSDAAALARRNGRAAVADGLEITSGSILLEVNDFAGAAAVFETLGKQSPTGPRSADAHILWGYSLGKLYDQRRTKSRREAYTAALVQHRQRFAGNTTDFEAAWMLGLLEERRLQYTKALKLYLEVPRLHPRSDLARLGATRCYLAILERLREIKRPADTWESEAVMTVSRFAADIPTLASNVQLPQAELLLGLARIELQRDIPGYLAADEALSRSIAAAETHVPAESPTDAKEGNAAGLITTSGTTAGGGTESATKDGHVDSAQLAGWKRIVAEARPLKIITLAGRGKAKEGRAELLAASKISAASLLEVVAGLARVVDQVEAGQRQDAAELLLTAGTRLSARETELRPQERERLGQLLAGAYRESDQPRKALETWEALLEKSPTRETLRTVARMQSDDGRPESLRKARSNWRKIEAQEKPGSPAWMTARYETARCALALREFGECRKLVQVTRVLYPELGGPDLREKFLKLLRAAEREEKS